MAEEKSSAAPCKKAPSASHCREGSCELPYELWDDTTAGTRPRSDSPAPHEEHELVAAKLRTQLGLQPLTIVVFGASGHLARTKTYPALFELFEDKVFPANISIVGYARSKKNPADFRKSISVKLKGDLVPSFLEKCTYFSGTGYGDDESLARFGKFLEEVESAQVTSCEIGGGRMCVANRLFYLATPPGVFAACAKGVKQHLSSVEAAGGWVRVIVEKPFGRDSESCESLLQSMALHLRESQIYRIDHYLAKEMVQNILVLRFGNVLWDTLWDRRSIRCVKITFKEEAGVDGRGGYYDEYGVVRDIFQNHLLQVLTLITMEAPVSLKDDDIRDEKVKVLRAIESPPLSRVVVGQYGASEDGSRAGYRADASVKSDSKQLTFLETVLFVNNSRWFGVPIVCKCGKGLEERAAMVRIQFKNEGLTLYPDAALNELVIRLQPKEAMWLKLNTKKPGYARFDKAYSNVLDLTYQQRFKGVKLPQAYSPLILDALRGDQSLFVRDDELREAWRITDPLLAAFENDPSFDPPLYPRGSRGPKEADALSLEYGFKKPVLMPADSKLTATKL